MLPICGPLPWVMIKRSSPAKRDFKCWRVSAVCSNCCGMVPGSPGRVMALPPRAMTRVSGIQFVFDGAICHGEGHDGLGGMQAVLRFVVNHRLRPVDHVVGDFVAAVGG